MATTFTSTVNTNTTAASSGSSVYNFSVGGGSAINTPWYGQNIPIPQQPNPFVPYPGSPPAVTVNTPGPPIDGTLAQISGKLYRYSASLNEWHEVVNADIPENEIAAAPILEIELDASAMLTALRQYAEFLEELDGLDQRTADIVSDTMFGLTEAISALESLEQE